MPVYSLPGSVVLEDKQERIGIVIEPYFDADILEEVSVAGNEFDLSVGELYLLIIWTVDEGVKFGPVFEQDKMSIMSSFYGNSFCFEYALSLELIFLVELENLLG